MSLTESQISQLNNEVRIGRLAQQAYDLYVKQHIDIAVANVYTGIENCSIVDKEALIELKGLLTAVRGLEVSILNDIETGKLAALQLEGEK